MITVSNDSELWNAIASDDTGETVHLAPGVAFTASVYKRARPDGIVTRIIGGDGSKLDVRLNETEGWSVENVGQLSYVGKSSRRLQIINCGAVGSHKFVDMRNCADVLIDGYHTDAVEFPVTLMAIENAEVKHGTIKRWSKDGLRLSAAENVTISKLHASDPDAPNNGDFHPDVIQYFASGSIKLSGRDHGSCRDVLIENVTLNTTDKSVQGIFFASPSDEWPAHERITIRNCDLFHGHPRGITLGRSVDSAILHNVLRHNDKALSFHGTETENYQPRVYLEDFQGHLFGNVQITPEGAESSEAGVRRGENVVHRFDPNAPTEADVLAAQVEALTAKVEAVTADRDALAAKITAAQAALNT